MFCTSCGTALGGSNAFCTSCGARIAATPVAPPAAKAETPAVVEASPEAPSDPFKPEGMSHADYAYQGIETAPARKSSKSLRLVLVAILALLILAITAGGMSLSSTQSNTTSETTGVQESSDEALVDPAPVDASNEAEVTEATDGDYYEYDGIFSYRWSDVDRTDTCDGCSYWMLDVKTTVDCSVIFVEMEVTNDAGAIVQTISNEAYDLKAGVAKLMTLDTWREDAAGGDVSQMTCQE